MDGPTRTTFTVVGMIDKGSARLIEMAVHGVDPAARVVVSLSAGLASVESAAPVARIRQAIEALGFIAEPTGRPFPLRRAPAAARAGVAAGIRAKVKVIGHAALWGLLCAFLAPAVTFVAVLFLNHFTAACGTPGDSGGCAMGLVSSTVLSIAPGAILGFLVALVHGVLRM